MKLRKEKEELSLLLRSVPGWVMSMFTASVVIMNLLANKSISFNVSFLALDCGTLASWAVFLCMDVLTVNFGAKAATEISFVALIVNAFTCLVCFIASRIPGVWSMGANEALDMTFGGSWYVLMGSSIAFASSAIVNNTINAFIGGLRKKGSKFAKYALRTYISTAVGQFADNMIFALIVSRVLFGWSLTQCVVCSLTTMAAELLCEIIFSPLGYAVSEAWKRNGVGQEYRALSAVSRIHRPYDLNKPGD